MKVEERIDVLVALGEYLQEDSEAKQMALLRTEQDNPWLTQANAQKALDNIATSFLDKDQLTQLANQYPLEAVPTPQIVGLVLAGNIPAVGFHDILCTFLSGHRAMIKYSDKDKHLIPFMLDFVQKQFPKTADAFIKVDQLKNFDAVIATGNNNSARYFEHYFSKYPHIIRKNRHAVAVLDGEESRSELLALGVDVFRYFGLGCRSVSKLYVPEEYDFPALMSVLDNYKDIMTHNKYKNNYDYNRSVYLLNQVEHLANDCLMVLEHESLLSRIASLHFERYTDIQDVEEKLNQHKSSIQCVATRLDSLSEEWPAVGLGQTQRPTITDYADGVDTMKFLVGLKQGE